MAEIISIANDGADIISTNFWHLEIARRGFFYLSTNAGVFRLLVPEQHLGTLREMRSADNVVVSRGPLTLEGQQIPDALELLFDDGTADPWSMHLSRGQLDHMPLDTDTTHTWTLTVWTHVVDDRCRRVLRKTAYYRRVRRLPDLRSWQG